MSLATIRIPTPLRSLTAGAGEVVVSATTVRQALDELERRHPGVLARVLDERGQTRGFVNVFLGETNVKKLGGLDAAVNGSAVISIVPAVAGGKR
jgi:molybdopterin converting factor small subunit